MCADLLAQYQADISSDMDSIGVEAQTDAVMVLSFLCEDYMHIKVMTNSTMKHFGVAAAWCTFVCFWLLPASSQRCDAWLGVSAFTRRSSLVSPMALRCSFTTSKWTSRSLAVGWGTKDCSWLSLTAFGEFVRCASPWEAFC